MKIIRNGVPCEMTQEEEMQRIPSAAERIEELKELLASTDYRTIKFVEGRLGGEEYEASRIQRAAWRAEIDHLEETIRREHTTE